jgi:SnoaL-like domain
MNTSEIATRLIALCREGKWETAQTELFAPDAVCREQEASPAFPQETKGLPAIIEKGKKWQAMVETIHAFSVSAPVVAGESFACTMTLDVTMKGQPRMEATELCVYLVKDGKIASESFYR